MSTNFDVPKRMQVLFHYYTNLNYKNLSSFFQEESRKGIIIRINTS